MCLLLRVILWFHSSLNYMFISAIEHSGPPIYILADSYVKKHEISVHMVEGFWIGTELDSCSYMVFCATRSANMEFNR